VRLMMAQPSLSTYSRPVTGWLMRMGWYRGLLKKMGVVTLLS